MKSESRPRTDPDLSQTPEVVGKLILYGLSQLSTDNAHHEFEHLCRHLARRRICSNILPATGPVSGGGDKGADFETLPIQSGFGVSKYWKLAAPGKFLFACSLEKNLKKKVKADVKAAAEFGEPVEQMYFFYPLPVKVGDRNKLKENAFGEHGIRLEIVDGKAIAEFLADNELSWIAERYLSLPSDIRLASPGSAPQWYSRLLAVPESELTPNSDTFYQLKAALRYAWADPEHHSEVPKLTLRVRQFRSHPDRVVARKAFYEEFVATLRGLNAAEGYESQLIEYLSAIPTLERPSELEDAAIVLSYLNGACARGILRVEPSVRVSFRDDLLAKLNSLITLPPTFVTCALLFVKGNVLLNSAALENAPREDATDVLTRAAEDGIAVWGTLLKYAREVRLFPVERLGPIVTFMVPLIASKKFDAFVKKLDAIISERAGAQSLAEQYLARASALLDKEDYLRALRGFHEALRLSHSLESQAMSITVCLQLSALYQHAGLYHAAKYYGLAAAFAALRFPEDDLRRLSAVGLAQAAEADYASGASLLFFLSFKTFILVAEEFAIAGKRSFREKQWAKVDFYSLLLTRAAKIVGAQCHSRCMALLTQMGGQDVYAATEDKLENMLGGLDRSALNARYEKEGIAAPFSDHAPLRVTLWRQFGINWRFEWPCTYEGERYGEALSATFQIVLAALSGTEFSMITTDVTVALNVTHEGGIEIKQVADNEVLRFAVAADPSRDMSLEDQMAFAGYILTSSSAIPEKDFTERFKDEFKQGLPQRIGVYISSAEVFRQFYSQTDYDDLHSGDPAGTPNPHATRTWRGISETSAVHPQFVESEALQLIRNRYDRSADLFPRTLRQLSSDSAFRLLVSKLRQSGWKDWHILLAVGNVRLNSLVNARDPAYKELARAVMRNGEGAEEPLTPASSFDEERLTAALRMSQLSTLTSMGFRVDQMTPSFPGIDAFLRRFKYWELDVPHEDPFAP